jgi:hypothetical protein
VSASKKIELLAVAAFISMSTMPVSLGTPAFTRSIDAIMAERLAALNAETGASLPSSAQLSAENGVGLLDVSGRDTIALPTTAVEMTRSVRELDFLLRIKIMALRAGESASPNKQGRLLAGLAGLYVSEAISSRDRLDRDRPIPYTPPSALDNTPAPASDDRLAGLLRLSFVETGCEVQIIDLLHRLSANLSKSQHKVARDSREVLRLLGPLAYHPATRCSADPLDSVYVQAVMEIG